MLLELIELDANIDVYPIVCAQGDNKLIEQFLELPQGDLAVVLVINFGGLLRPGAAVEIDPYTDGAELVEDHPGVDHVILTVNSNPVEGDTVKSFPAIEQGLETFPYQVFCLLLVVVLPFIFHSAPFECYIGALTGR